MSYVSAMFAMGFFAGLSCGLAIFLWWVLRAGDEDEDGADDDEIGWPVAMTDVSNGRVKRAS